eukprot:1256526-Amorphochlora_amoeboformis.AAC.1
MKPVPVAFLGSEGSFTCDAAKLSIVFHPPVVTFLLFHADEQICQLALWGWGFHRDLVLVRNVVRAMKYFGDAGQPIIPKGYPSFESVFKAVSSGDVYAGVVPIESTWSGSFARCYDSLLRHKNVSIAGELSVLDAHCLCALRGSSKVGAHITLSNNNYNHVIPF